MKKNKNDGREFEDLIQYIENVVSKYPGTTIKKRKKFFDKKGEGKREHDIVIETKIGHHNLIIAIECKDRSRKVGSEHVEGFWAKCNDTGINQGIIVSSKGFTKPALKKAEHYGIRCLNLEEAFKFDWLLTQTFILYKRYISSINWVLIPDSDLEKGIEEYLLIDEKGIEVKIENMNSYIKNKLNDQDPLNENLGLNKLRFRIDNHGLRLKCKETMKISNLKTVIADCSYNLTRELSPFRCKKYSDEITGELIAEAAYAEIKAEKLNGKIMIIQKEGGGGQILFVNDQKRL